MRAAAEAAGFTVEFKNVSWYAIFAGLDGGKYNAVISCITVTPERSKPYDFSIPYWQGEQVLVALKDDTTIRSLDDLHQKKLGVLKGSSTARKLEEGNTEHGIEVVLYDSCEDAFYALVSGELSAMIWDKLQAGTWLQNPTDRELIRIAGSAVFKEDYAVVMKKGNAAVLAAINEGIAAV
jgi:ABC-type amino acid transport substrate-binding protein